MNGRWLGAMPVDAFLNKYIPATKKPLSDLPDNPFENVPRDGMESGLYDPFITAIQRWMPHLQAVNTSNKDDIANKLNLKTDISMYNRVEAKKDGAAFQDPRDDTEEKRVLAIETGSFTPDTDKGNRARGQLAHYAGALHSQQFRHFSFSIFVQGDHARFLRWDPSGAVVTAAFNYRANPRLMAEFLWRFNHLSPEQRGHDVSVRPANLVPEVDARVREKLGIQDQNIPLYKYEVPGLAGLGYSYGPRPPTQNRSLVSRCTRTSPAVWIPTEVVDSGPRSCGEPEPPSEHNADQLSSQDGLKKGPWSEVRLVYMKDTWRFLSDLPDVDMRPEHEIYEILRHHKTPNIPELVVGGDVEGGRTRTQEFVDAPWLCVKPRISPYQHYRLLHGIVGRPLFKYECTKQLVAAVFDALKAHAHAVEHARILHRDISAGNIILTDEGKGLLIDWELAKLMSERGSRRPDRTGTWQFMSANLLWQPGKMHTVTDDLESFMHVLGWMTLRYVPACDSYNARRRGKDMALLFDDYDEGEECIVQGGREKRMALRGESYPSDTFEPRTPTPLRGLLKDLSFPFKSFYAMWPPTAEDRKKANVPTECLDRQLIKLRYDIEQYDQDIEDLQSPTWFINTMKTALNKKEWPTDDKADDKLPIAFPRAAPRQAQHKADELRQSQSVWEHATAVRSSSKRAASPTPGPTSKRHRGTPAASRIQS
ncbi:hypothetical protein EV363DRAFT_1351495 [Boletus edulis]|nr:hypothetical protein EV363DRAFT_1351495 [Boletus edulis]